MADFNTSYNISMRHESGYYSGAGDTGGETYKGISRVFHPKWEGWPILDAYKRKRALRRGEVIHDARLETAVKKFFKINFWDSLMSGTQIQSQTVANFLFDFVVHKQYGAVAQIQTAIQKVFPKAQASSLRLSTDSINLINAYPGAVYPAIYQQRIDYYARLGGSYVSQWIARVRKFPTKIEPFNLFTWFLKLFV